MEYRNFDIDILINDTLSEISPSEFSFSISDNIDTFYPKMEMTINDSTGLMTEFYLFAMGNILDVSYGIEDKLIQNKFIVNSSELQNPFNSEFINGRITIDLIHEFFSEQAKESFAYEGTPSDIIEELLNDRVFNKKFIDSTENDHIWYRPFITQKEMIYEILLENAFSHDSNDTPFFSFIDSNNNFHFESFFTMMERAPVKDLEYFPNTFDSSTDGKIHLLLPFSDAYKKLFDHLLWKYFYSNEESLELQEIELAINDIYTKTPEYPINKESNTTSNIKILSDLEDVTENDSLGQQLFLLKKGLLPLKMLVLTDFDPDLIAGQNVNVNASSSVESNSSSIGHSGKYLIEKSKHSWDGKSQTGYTQLVLGRKGTTLSSDYLIKEKFLK